MFNRFIFVLFVCCLLLGCVVFSIADSRPTGECILESVGVDMTEDKGNTMFAEWPVGGTPCDIVGSVGNGVVISDSKPSRGCVKPLSTRASVLKYPYKG